MRDVVGFWSGYWPPIAVVIGGLLLGYLVQRATIPLLARLAARSAWKFDDLIIDAIKWPMVLWFALGGLRVAVRMLPLHPRADQVVGAVIVVVGILSVTWAIARFASAAVSSSSMVGTAHNVSLLASVARWTVVIVGALVALQTLGVRITPVITALGVGGLAVGLALQDTLANFFSGIRILAARKIRVGDFVKLESGQDGWVQDIAWGQTVIRQGLGNIVIVPNAKLAQAITTNYNMPALEQLFVQTLTVGRDSDLDAVEEIALAAGREAMRAVPEGSPDFDPAVRFNAFTDAGVQFIIVLKARSFPDHAVVMHEFYKRVHRRFRDAKIELGTPGRLVRAIEPDPPPKP